MQRSACEKMDMWWRGLIARVSVSAVVTSAKLPMGFVLPRERAFGIKNKLLAQPDLVCGRPYYSCDMASEQLFCSGKRYEF